MTRSKKEKHNSTAIATDIRENKFTNMQNNEKQKLTNLTNIHL